MGSAIYDSVCFVPDLHAYALQGEFLSLPITSVNTCNGYYLIIFRHIHRKNRIFLIPALCVFTQQRG